MTDRPQPPDDLCDTAKQCWHDLALGLGVWGPADLPVLRVACQWYARFAEADAAAKATSDPKERWHHESRLSMASKQFASCLKLLGMGKSFRISKR